MPLSPLITALDTDWTRIATSRTATSALARWASYEPALAGYADLAAIEAHVHNRTTPTGEIDAVFAALLRAHRTGDDLAGRMVLALLSPAIKRHRPYGPDETEHVAILLAHVWRAICRYPLDRQWQLIPATVMLNARRDAIAEIIAAKTRPAPAVGVTPARGVAAQAGWTDRIHDRVDLGLAAIDANLDRDDLSLIALTRLGGWRISDLAEPTEAARLRQRRRRAEARLSRQLASH